MVKKPVTDKGPIVGLPLLVMSGKPAWGTQVPARGGPFVAHHGDYQPINPYFMKKQFAFLVIFTALFLGSVTTVSAATSGVVTYSINHAVKAGDRLTITATFSASLLNTPPLKITISGADDNGGASAMTKVDDMHYVYTHTVSGASGGGNAIVEFSNGVDTLGDAIITTPASGGMYVVDNYINPLLKTGAVTAMGGTVVAGKWNSTNTSVNVTVPIDNDSTLIGGLLQLLAGVGGSSQYVGNNYTIQAGDINGNKILSITAAQLEVVDSFADNASVHFIAKITDSAGNTTTGTASATLLTVDQTMPTATVSYDKTTSTNSDVVATITPSESVTVTNNNGSFSHTFTTNGAFTFNFTDNAGNTNVATASVGNITTTPVSCTSWTYSEWSSCSVSGTQTRSTVSSSPNSCAGGSPIVSQSCTYVAPIVACTTNDWSCTGWNSCSASGSQTRTCSKVSSCQGGVASPAISQSCTYVPPQATSTTPIVPTPTVPQTPSCTADIWSCDGWNSCSLSGVQNRSCRKTFDCPNVETAPPATDQYCEAPNRPAQQVPQDSSAITNQDTIIKATVKLACLFDEDSGMLGSGTVIDSSGTILTNKHVVDGTKLCFVGFVNDFNDEPYFEDRQIADILKVSQDEDMAILKLRNPQNKKIAYVDITKSNSNLRLGTKVHVYGYPAKFGTNITYTSGDFSGTSGSYLKTTAIIEHGNSGGGSYLNDGNFIGIPSAVLRGELNAMGYILSINIINAWLGNSTIARNGNSNQNNFSRVSANLENIDLKKLNSIKLIIPKTDSKGNNTIVAVPQKEGVSLERDVAILNTQIKKAPDVKNIQKEVEEKIPNFADVATSTEEEKPRSLWVRIMRWFGF